MADTLPTLATEFGQIDRPIVELLGTRRTGVIAEAVRMGMLGVVDHPVLLDEKLVALFGFAHTGAYNNGDIDDELIHAVSSKLNVRVEKKHTRVLTPEIVYSILSRRYLGDKYREKLASIEFNRRHVIVTIDCVIWTLNLIDTPLSQRIIRYIDFLCSSIVKPTLHSSELERQHLEQPRPLSIDLDLDCVAEMYGGVRSVLVYHECAQFPDGLVVDVVTPSSLLMLSRVDDVTRTVFQIQHAAMAMRARGKRKWIHLTDYHSWDPAHVRAIRHLRQIGVVATHGLFGRLRPF